MDKKILIGSGIILLIIICGILIGKNFQNLKNNQVDSVTQTDNDLLKKMATNKDSDFKCVNDVDCKFVFTKMEESCTSCTYSSVDWECFEKERAKQEWAKWAEQHKNILCEKCLESETDFDKFECKCINNACIKNNK